MISWPADVTAERCPGRVRRQIGVDTEVIDGRIVYSARLRDRWENPDTGESEDIHGWDLRLQTRPPDLTIVAAEAIPAALPFPECPAAALAARQLIGAKLTSGFPEEAKAAFKGVAGCTHLLTLATAIWSQQVVSIYLYGRDEDPASREGTSTPRAVDVCSGWRSGGMAVNLVRAQLPFPRSRQHTECSGRRSS